jgi:hypothetical protein
MIRGWPRKGPTWMRYVSRPFHYNRQCTQTVELIIPAKCRHNPVHTAWIASSEVLRRGGRACASSRNRCIQPLFLVCRVQAVLLSVAAFKVCPGAANKMPAAHLSWGVYAIQPPDGSGRGPATSSLSTPSSRFSSSGPPSAGRPWVPW